MTYAEAWFNIAELKSPMGDNKYIIISPSQITLMVSVDVKHHVYFSIAYCLVLPATPGSVRRRQEVRVSGSSSGH